jgi:hypothetical protein
MLDAKHHAGSRLLQINANANANNANEQCRTMNHEPPESRIQNPESDMRLKTTTTVTVASENLI